MSKPLHYTCKQANLSLIKVHTKIKLSTLSIRPHAHYPYSNNNTSHAVNLEKRNEQNNNKDGGGGGGHLIGTALISIPLCRRPKQTIPDIFVYTDRHTKFALFFSSRGGASANTSRECGENRRCKYLIKFTPPVHLWPAAADRSRPRSIFNAGWGYVKFKLASGLFSKK